jgi:hypothetical protein
MWQIADGFARKNAKEEERVKFFAPPSTMLGRRFSFQKLLTLA